MSSGEAESGPSAKAVVITGCSSGIGRVSALRMAESGWRVYAGVRSKADAESLRSENSMIEPLRVEVTDAGSIADAAARVAAERPGGLDGLVNNAGIGVGGAVETIPIDDFRRLIETNLIGHVAVTQAFLPQVRQARGCLVFISSLGGRVAFPYASAYHASKFGIEAVTESLRGEVADAEVVVSVIEPAAFATKIWEKGATQVKAQREKLSPELTEIYGEALEGFEDRLRSAAENSDDPSDVADIVEEALTSRSPKDRYLVGQGARATTALRAVLPASVWDRIAARVTTKGRSPFALRSDFKVNAAG